MDELRTKHLQLRNLARRVTDDAQEQAQIFKEVDDFCAAELRSAFIKIESFEIFRGSKESGLREVPTQHMGVHCRWSFRRSWKYWVAEGPGIPPEHAEPFHQIWGHECRVEGDCAAPSPLEACEGFAVGMYHIDTQEALAHFAALLAVIYRPNKEKK